MNSVLNQVRNQVTHQVTNWVHDQVRHSIDVQVFLNVKNQAGWHGHNLVENEVYRRFYVQLKRELT